MEHREYLHLVPDSDTAVLFIHGILGTPNHFSRLLPLVPKTWSVHNLLLDGHGKGVRDFSRTSMGAWRAQVEEAVQQLAQNHKQLLIVGHSMGTLLAIEQAVRPGSKVAGLFLLAAPLKLRLRFRMVTSSLKVCFGRIRPDDIYALAAADACGIRQEWQLWRYLGWVPRFLELFRQIRYTRSLLPQLNIPCEAFQSRNDEMVSLSACKLLEGSSEVTVLARSTHYYYDPEDIETVLRSFTQFCCRWISSTLHPEVRP